MAIAIISIFIIGYLAIAFEQTIRINKAAISLVTGVLCWTIYIINTDDKTLVSQQLASHLGEIAQILFFLLGAMTIVELIDAHDGFEIITRRIQTTNKKKLMWVLGLLSFFLSAILDNLTTTIVMISLLRKLVNEKSDRWMLAGLVIIAANAGGAWSPIGDVTTTMLWIGNQVSAPNIIIKLIFPSLIAIIVPLFLAGFIFKGNVSRPAEAYVSSDMSKQSKRRRNIIFSIGLLVLVLVPVFKAVTHLPPFMGILVGVGILWIVTEIIHGRTGEEDRRDYSVAKALQKIDTPSILFFLGILLAVAALQSTGQLPAAAQRIDEKLGSLNMVAITIGLFSSIIDNVPLVAATQGMYGLDQYPTDHYFWVMLCYTAATGGSILIIGSASGVAAMGMEKMDMIWYLKKISWLALLGFLAGVLVYILQQQLLKA